MFQRFLKEKYKPLKFNKVEKKYLPKLGLSTLLLLIISAISFFIWPLERFVGELLVINLFLLLVSFSSVFFLSIHFISGSSWWQYFQSVPASMFHPLLPAGLLILLIVMGLQSDIFPYGLNADIIEGFSGFYFSRNPLIIRIIIILVLWIGIARLCIEFIRKAFLTADPVTIKKARNYSVLFVISHVLFISFVAWDWVIFLHEGFISTVFSWFLFTGIFAASVGFIILSRNLLVYSDIIPKSEEIQNINLGKYLFVFSILWGYLWYSQYMLIWYGNLPEETLFFITQIENFALLFRLNLVLSFVIPFVMLLPLKTKRNPTILGFVSVSVITGQLINLYISIMPGLMKEGFDFSIWSILLSVAFFIQYYFQIEYGHQKYTRQKFALA